MPPWVIRFFGLPGMLGKPNLRLSRCHPNQGEVNPNCKGVPGNGGGLVNIVASDIGRSKIGGGRVSIMLGQSELSDSEVTASGGSGTSANGHDGTVCINGVLRE